MKLSCRLKGKLRLRLVLSTLLGRSSGIPPCGEYVNWGGRGGGQATIQYVMDEVFSYINFFIAPAVNGEIVAYCRVDKLWLPIKCLQCLFFGA